MADGSPEERLRILAERLMAIGPGTLGDVLDELAVAADEVHLIADALHASATTAASVSHLRFCTKKGTGRSLDPCDRPHGHKGRHSYEADVLARRVGEYEQKLAVLPGLRQETNRLRSDLRRANEALNEVVLEQAAMRQPRR